MLGEQYWNQRAVLVMTRPDGDLFVSDPMDRWLAEWLLVNVVSVTAEYEGQAVICAHIENLPRKTELKHVQVPVR